ncbi:MAG TPA: DNA polymerase/3'-5' exonuclease PolX [bacterium]|nr:DNA polymerase/3'-5' exonuclease PolX [bacterium]
MDKRSIVAALEEMGELLEIQGENPFKTRAYQQAAQLLQGMAEEPADLVKSGKLGELRGIGPALNQKITEMVQTGSSTYLNELRRKVPPGLLELLKIPGLGPRKAKVLYDQLGIQSLGELEYACAENRLLELKGFGAKTQENILKGITLIRSHSGRFLFDVASRQAKDLLGFLKSQPGVGQAEIAGSLRRRKETIGDVDLLASVKGSPHKIIEAWLKHPQVQDILASGETKVSVRLTSGLQVDLRLVSAAEFPFAWLYFTGSKEHNTLLRGIAKDHGLKLNEYGLFKGEKPTLCRNEAEIYRALGMHFIPPEVREGMGEIEFAAQRPFPRLIEEQDLRGIFHVHSDWSDGSAPILEMGREAERLGFEYLGLSDHSQTAVYAGGLKAADLKAQAKEIAAANKKLKKLRVLQGIESDILADGGLDYPAKTLDSLDFVIASVHQRFKLDRQAMTRRMLKAIADPHTRILGHISGRLLLGRDGYELDYDAIFAEAAKRRVAIEINANPHRFDLDWRYVRRAKEAGVKFAIDPDAHSVAGLSDTFLGIGLARKGWLTKDDVINTGSLEEVESFLRRKP